MSSPIMPIGSPADPPTTSAPAIERGSIAAFVSEIGTDADEPRIMAHEGRPPRAVLDAVEEAASVHERLTGGGHELRFTSRTGASMQVELVDAAGTTVRELSLTEAFAIAAGEATV